MELLDIYYMLVLFVLGTILGSFYNVVGDRLPNNESIVKPASHCPKCKHFLKPLELIPIFSYIFQRGKCKDCGGKIPWVHPVFELLSGSLFALSYFVFGFSIELLIALTFISMLLIILISDLNYMIIPDEVLIVGSILLILEIGFGYGILKLMLSISNGIIAFLLMYLLKMFGDFLFKRESMGGGDIKLMFVFGLVLNWQTAILAIFIGSFVGLPISLFVINKLKNNEIPFGPFLSLGAVILLLSKIDFNTILNLLMK